MLHVAIVEDDPTYTQKLQRYLRKFEEDTHEKCIISCFDDGSKIVADYQAEYDIILMDVDMRVMNGMVAAEKIRKLDSDVVIIFITNLSQYAIKGYAVDALDYVLKPISYYDFTQCISRAVSRMRRRKEQRFLRIHIKNGVKKLDISHIYFIEVDRRQLLYHTTGGVIIATGPLSRVESELAEADFFRCNKGIIVNLDHVTSMEGNYAVVGGEIVQISRSKKKPLLDAINNHFNEDSK